MVSIQIPHFIFYYCINNINLITQNNMLYINRRQWFKRIGKILPILALALAPQAKLMASSSPTNCEGNCEAYCKSSCVEQCSRGCESKCTGCSNECASSCANSCYHYCRGGCKTSCGASCDGTCRGLCAVGCTGCTHIAK